MSEPFWQRSLDSITYADVVAFLDEENPEGANLEYKGATLKQNGLPDFTNKVLETFVAFANTGGGMMLYGVDEDPITKLPIITKGIEAPTPRAQQLRDLAVPLMSRCAQSINPRIPMETKQLVIEDGAAAGNKLLVIRVRQGSQPPYSLDNRLIHIRNGEDDPLATVTEIEALFRRRVDRAVDAATPEKMMEMNVFDYAALASQDDPQCLIIGLTPAFPAPIIPANIETDSAFKRICLDVFRENEAIIRHPRGITYLPSLDPNRRDNPSCAMAFDNGSIGIRRPLGIHRAARIELAGVWQIMREILYHAARWPRSIFHYGGPLICQFAVSNIDGVTVGDEATPRWIFEVAEPFRNRMKAWYDEHEWSAGMARDDVIEPALHSLARQLQYPYFQAIADAKRDETEGWVSL